MHSSTKTETLLGGASHEITLADGTTITVKVRQIRLKEYEAAGSIADQEFRLVELVCDQPAGWVETVSPDSFELLATEMRRLNPSFFAWLVRKQADLYRKTPPWLLERAVAEATRAAAGSLSATSSGTLRPRG